MTTVQIPEALVSQLLKWSGKNDQALALQDAIDVYIRAQKRKLIKAHKGKIDLDIDLAKLRGDDDLD